MSNLAIEQLNVNPDNGGMGTGPSDILIPKINDVFAKTTSLSLLDSLEPKEKEPSEPSEKEPEQEPSEKITSAAGLSILNEISNLSEEEGGGASAGSEEGSKGRRKSDRNIMVNFL
jgi:hypothetical protein